MQLGLTGSIATGKSTVYERMLKDPRLVGFDADAVVHHLYAQREVIEQLADIFGGAILSPDGTANRDRLRELFLKDSGVKGQLEEIFHPRVRRAYQTLLAQVRSDQIILADIPLLLERNVPYEFDGVVVVACSSQTQLLRLKARSSLDTETARELINMQIALTSKIDKADYVLWNEGSPLQLQRQIDTLVHHLFNE